MEIDFAAFADAFPKAVNLLIQLEKDDKKMPYWEFGIQIGICPDDNKWLVAYRRPIMTMLHMLASTDSYFNKGRTLAYDRVVNGKTGIAMVKSADRPLITIRPNAVLQILKLADPVAREKAWERTIKKAVSPAKTVPRKPGTSIVVDHQWYQVTFTDHRTYFESYGGFEGRPKAEGWANMMSSQVDYLEYWPFLIIQNAKFLGHPAAALKKRAPRPSDKINTIISPMVL